jgi:SAM-dependent methyltransferase
MTNFYIPLSPIRPVLKFNQSQLNHRNYIQEALTNGNLKLVESKCFCGSIKSFKILSYDAWGFNIPTIMCKKCYTIRSKYFFDKSSILKFYNEGYYKAHMFTYSSEDNGIGMKIVDYWLEEVNKGGFIYEYLHKNCKLENKLTVLEIGCGLGGNLKMFAENGYVAYGCDFNNEYISKGKEFFPKLNLSVGGMNNYQGKKFSIIILSDLMEHLIDYEDFMSELIPLLEKDSIIYINVPGIFNIGFRKFGCNIRQFTKIEHTWCHTFESLTLLMKLYKFEVITGDQGIRAIYKYSPNLDINYKSNKANIFYLIKLCVFMAFTYLKKISQLSSLVILVTNSKMYIKAKNFIIDMIK